MLARLPIAVPPARHELLASYLARLANLHGIYATELHALVRAVDQPGAALAALTGRPREQLAAALPELRDPTHDQPAFRHEPQPGCPRCDALHPGGPVLRLLPHHHYVCLRHRHWIGQPDIAAPPTALAALPDVVHAQRRHLRLLRRHGEAATYDAVLTGYLICGHLWTRPPETTIEASRRWSQRAARLIPDPFADFTASRVFAAVYPEAVDLAGLLANQRWRSLAHGDPQQRQQFLTEIGRRLGAQAAYTPHDSRDAIAHWMSWDSPRPPLAPPRTHPGAHARGSAFATGKTNRTRHESSRFWFSRRGDGGTVILHHRHIRPAVIRPWSPAMASFEGAIWASTSLDPAPAADLIESAT